VEFLLVAAATLAMATLALGLLLPLLSRDTVGDRRRRDDARAETTVGH
jgi:hypothetical protein